MVTIALSFGCTQPPGKPDDVRTPAAIDSLVLERTVCFGFCPAYRLRISSLDQIRFESRNRGDSANVATDTAPRGTYDSLVARARAIDFYDFPPEITQDSTLCRRRATDLPTVVTTIFSADKTARVSDYHGCFDAVGITTIPRLKRLRAFEDEIDTVLHSSRWVRQNRSRS